MTVGGDSCVVFVVIFIIIIITFWSCFVVVIASTSEGLVPFFFFFKVSFCFLYILFSLNSFVSLCLVSYLFIYFSRMSGGLCLCFHIEERQEGGEGGLEASLQNGTHPLTRTPCYLHLLCR